MGGRGEPSCVSGAIAGARPCLQEGVCLGERAQSRCETRGLVGDGVCLRAPGSARGRALARVSGARVFMCGAAGARGRGARSCSVAALSSPPSVRGPAPLAWIPARGARTQPEQRRRLCFPCAQGQWGKLRGKVWKKLLRAGLTCSPEARARGHLFIHGHPGWVVLLLDLTWLEVAPTLPNPLATVEQRDPLLRLAHCLLVSSSYLVH